MRVRYVVVTSCVCAWWTELKTNECEALGGDINEAQHEDYVARVFERSVTAKPWTNHYIKYGKYVVYTCLKTRYRKAEGNTKQTRLIVCLRPLQEHTHT